ncbi:hypothetical protein EQG68_05665 [Flavobacterium piscinae]|uniref:Uncharacterized protein n=1 Tax=Flavobacterium piscinae TaxID=2506424 RepID=A0A4Q1KU98_9FLAO|nr:hypothetical protein [Flavobacterium piscinae]RXR32979.1 hypothetical protein EQG68_05665 [Flavobacterium piscinae]
MKYIFAFCYILSTSFAFSQHGISRFREFSCDFDKNGTLDKAYCTLEKGESFSSIQTTIYFYDENQIIKECISKKITFEANDSENNPQLIYVAVFNYNEEDNSILLLIRRNKIDYFFSFVYDNYDFDLLYHNETDKNDYFRYFKQINFREKKIIINKIDPESNENLIYNFPYVKSTIPKLSDFEFGSIEWPKLK